MAENDYHEQRRLGAQEIVAMIRVTAHEAGLADIHCEWDYGHPMVERDNHILNLFFGKCSCQDTFSDEELADFPGKVGTERTKAKITAMIKTLVKNAL